MNLPFDVRRSSFSLFRAGGVSYKDLAPLRPRMKLRQNGMVSLLIRLAVFQARGAAYMKLHKIRCRSKKYLTRSLSTQRLFNFFSRRSLRSPRWTLLFLFWLDWSLFRPEAALIWNYTAKVSFSIKLAGFPASGGADTQNLIPISCTI